MSDSPRFSFKKVFESVEKRARRGNTLWDHKNVRYIKLKTFLSVNLWATIGKAAKFSLLHLTTFFEANSQALSIEIGVLI